MGTALYEERRAMRRGMTARWSELRVAFAEHAAVVQAQAGFLGIERVGEIAERYGLDFGSRGTSIDVFLWQWRRLLTWNSEPCPF